MMEINLTLSYEESELDELEGDETDRAPRGIDILNYYK